MKRWIEWCLVKLTRRLKQPVFGPEGLFLGLRVPEVLAKGQWVGMIYLDIVEYQLMEQVYGSLSCLRVLQVLDKTVNESAPSYLHPYQLLEVRRWGDDLLIFFHSPTLPPPAPAELEGLAFALRDKLSDGLNQTCVHLLPHPLNFHAGYYILHPGPGNIEKALYNAFKEAVLIAKGQLDAKEVERRQEFKELLAQKKVKIVYQPVVSLETGEIVGYEALARGPENTFFASPLNLFGYAEKTNQLYPLEKITREKALAGVKEVLKEKRLFLNLSPPVINDPAFHPTEIKEFLTSAGAKAEQLVFEITERTAIEDFSAYRRSLEQYRRHGFLVAVDDAGAGYSSLQAIAELQPDFIKIDLSLIKDIDKTPVKRLLVETFLNFAQKTNSQLIAEGIETAGELATLIEIGIALGQGFFLARPAYPPPVIYPEALQQIQRAPRLRRWIPSGRMIPVGTIAQATLAFPANTPTKTLLDYFTAHPKVEGAVILEEEYPVGLVMRDKLFNQLSTQYGFAVYMERPVSLVMDNQPLVVEEDTPVEMVSQAVVNRTEHKIYDSVIVTRNRGYLGLVSVRRLLDVLTSMHLEAARFANPLTGLPGNRQIEEELCRRLSSAEHFSVVYSDLDHFKGFNDCYGFERGDQAIKLTAAVLAQKVKEHGLPDDFVGHIGGDDFVIITRPQVVEAICQNIIKAFDRAILDLYEPADRERGWILSTDRQGREVRLPVMSISLAVINCAPQEYTSLEELARSSAELKKYAKSKPGSVYVQERRRRVIC